MNDIPNQGRLKEIDFLRGIAIILVLFRHAELFEITARVGWIGVDLFFVLSGFLVSGLLFKEYLRHGSVRPFLFLIRRGFKIYPTFYIFSILSFGISIIGFKLTHRPMFVISKNAFYGEISFLQNYVGAFWNHTWSLAVEEHFYILLVISVYLLSRNGQLENLTLFLLSCLGIFVACFCLRFFYSLNHPGGAVFKTHFRLDSLLMGVLIGYLYHFRINDLKRNVLLYKKWILAFSLLLILVGLLDYDRYYFFMSTIGLTVLYIGFGGILVIFLFVDDYVELLKKVISKRIFFVITQIGFYSYTIYLFHMFVRRYFIGAIKQVLMLDVYSSFLIYFLLSILLGYLVSKIIELPFLRMREIYFRKRD